MKNSKSQCSFVILGANGFVGRTLMQGDVMYPVKAVVRQKPSDAHVFSDTITWYCADLLVPGSLDDIIEPGDIVINLAYMRRRDGADNRRMIMTILDGCLKKQVKRFVHCSTAVVVGNNKTTRVDETTLCMPGTAYEKTKLMLEQCIQAAVLKGLDAAILRPTAIVGVGGQNLLKLANSLMHGYPLVNYIRACFFYKRTMNLVPVRHVTMAILHLATYPEIQCGDVYFVSSDNDPDNNYLSVERMLLQALGLRNRRVPIIPVPKVCLSMVLRGMGRTSFNVDRTYDAQKLLATQVVLSDTVWTAVSDFGENLRRKRQE